MIDYDGTFKVIKYLTNENDYLPWVIAISRLRYISDQLEYTAAYGNLQNYLQSLIQNRYDELGWEENKMSDSWLDRYK